MPAANDELSGLAATAAGRTDARNGYQRNTAHDSGTVYATQYGSQYIHHSPPREPK